MSVERRIIKAPSSDGIHTLAGVLYLPAGEVKGIFHIVHGMTEYIGRYEKFMQDMAAEGYAACGYDNLGHGQTARDDGELGFIAERRGWELLARDVAVFRNAVEAEVGEHPYILMGHSMGSFIARLAAARFTRPDRLIIMGTGGKNPLSAPGIMIIDAVKLFKGGKYISKFVDNLTFGDYNKSFADDGVPNPWLTSDIEIRKKYAADKYCTFKFTVSAMGDLVRLLKYTNSSSWYKTLECELPVLLVSGERDPVGNFGKGVREVHERLQKSGHNSTLVLYPDGRHEILNDTTYPKVKEDILQFIQFIQ
ncbi:MAG: alpha/beta hydrolase [Ruminococcaceae bacterium]|nr:alpha/beta hydrolase [Oscillospiraceae bacterium]